MHCTTMHNYHSGNYFVRLQGHTAKDGRPLPQTTWDTFHKFSFRLNTVQARDDERHIIITSNQILSFHYSGINTYQMVQLLCAICQPCASGRWQKKPRQLWEMQRAALQWRCQWWHLSIEIYLMKYLQGHRHWLGLKVIHHWQKDHHNPCPW